MITLASEDYIVRPVCTLYTSHSAALCASIAAPFITHACRYATQPQLNVPTGDRQVDTRLCDRRHITVPLARQGSTRRTGLELLVGKNCRCLSMMDMLIAQTVEPRTFHRAVWKRHPGARERVSRARDSAGR